jgi:hypothetical protein
MNIEDIPREEYVKIYNRIMADKEAQAIDIFKQLETDWASYDMKTKLSMFNYIICQMIHMITIATHDESKIKDFMILAHLLTQPCQYILSFFIAQMIVEEYEKNLTPEVDELKRMMDL